MFSLFFIDPLDEDLLAADLCEAGTAGITEEPGGMRAFFEDGEEMVILRRFAVRSPVFRREPETDWERKTLDSFHPLEIGRKLFLAPPWNHDPVPAGRIRLEILPGMACGTGWHTCTQLCLEALEQIIDLGDRVLDVGTGSGILSVAATLLGARSVAACDLDEAAVRIAAVRISGLVFCGSAEAVRDHWADIVIANISSAAVESLRGEFARVSRSRESTLILSGFSEDDPPAGYATDEISLRDGWACWICRA